MIRAAPLVTLTLRGLLDRRRVWLMVALAAIPVLVTLIVVAFSDESVNEHVFDNLVIQIVLPLIALISATAAIDTDLDEGTIVYLLAKPVRRVRIVGAKSLVAAGLTAALVVPAMLLTGLIAATADDSLLGTSAAYAVAAAVGGVAYVMLFLAIRMFTSRALAVGLIYVLLWEGTLSDLFDGTRMFSIRQATLGLAAELSGAPAGSAVLDVTRSIVILAVVILGAGALATWRMSRYELRGGD
jgi:ABC-2 type transport system permease protein